MKDQELIDAALKPGKRSFDVVCAEIFENFDFEKVHKAMMSLDWVWVFKNEFGYYEGVPNIPMLKSEARNLLKRVFDRETTQSSSGGFTAFEDDGDLCLRFTLNEQYSSLETQ